MTVSLPDAMSASLRAAQDTVVGLLVDEVVWCVESTHGAYPALSEPTLERLQILAGVLVSRDLDAAERDALLVEGLSQVLVQSGVPPRAQARAVRSLSARLTPFASH